MAEGAERPETAVPIGDGAWAHAADTPDACDLLTTVGACLIRETESDSAIDGVSAHLGRAYAAARCTWLEFAEDGRGATVLADWQADGGVPLAGAITVDALTSLANEAAADSRVLHVPVVEDGSTRLLLVLSRPRPWHDVDRELLRRVGALVWAGVARGRREAELARAHAALERRIVGQTHALASAHDALREQAAERRAAERQIAQLFERLVTTQENERRRVARDIHDQLGQQITALRMHLEALSAGAAAPAGRRQLERLQRLAEELDRSVDGLTWDLMPAALDDLGLAAALQHLVRGWSDRCGIAASFEASGLERLRFAPEREANLYRLTQEALHNVHKHADARHVAVSLGRGTDRAVLVIEDDGCGFAPEEAEHGDGLGLMSMRERATLAGGLLEIESAPGRGTSVIVTVPIAVGHLGR